MPADILDKLKEKELEMETLIGKARKKAAFIKEEALNKALGIKAAKLKELDEEIMALEASEDERIASEVSRFEEEARKAAEGFKCCEPSKRLKAVKEVMRIIMTAGTEGADDRGDDKGPDNRAKGPSR